MNLHDWIDELCDALDLEDVEVDEALVADLASATTDRVHRLAGPVTTYLVGYAAAQQHVRPAELETLVERVHDLAKGWDRPAGAVERDDPPADEGGDDYSGDLDLGAGDADDAEDAADPDDDLLAQAG